MSMKSVFLRSFLIVFLAGILAIPVFARESRSLLHVPWGLFENELLNAAQDGRLWRNAVPGATVMAEGLPWNLSNVKFDAQVQMEKPIFDGQRLVVRIQNLSVRIGVDTLSVDHVIQREVGNVIIPVRVQASCGPIRLIQERASAEAEVSLDWSTGTPVARLKSLELAWAPDSWTISEFACQGPAGLDAVLRQELLKRSKQASEFKPLLADWLGGELQSRLQAALAGMKKPVNMGTGEGLIALRAGRMSPGTTGLYTELILGGAAETDPTDGAVKPPAPDVQSQLPNDRPVLVGAIDLIEHVVQNELTARPDLITVDLQTMSTFRRVIQSRFLQFFFWQDLFNYSANDPFYLRLKTPKDLTLSSSGDGRLNTALPLQAVMQSRRDGKWWDYVTANGNAQADIDIDLRDGVFKYTTSLKDPRVNIVYGSAYRARYNPSGWLPTSSMRGALEGPQSALSGTLRFPDVDLGPAGKYRASQMNWLDPRTFVISWQKTE